MNLYSRLLAQSGTFSFYLEPVSVPGVGGVQSYAFAQHNGQWLIIGGRLDGLHQRQPWAAFDPSGNNNQIIVIDPIAKQKWSAPVVSLPAPLREQLSSTNMEFFQNGEFLYLVGGYGFSPTADDHVTFDKLTAVEVPALINAVVNGTAIGAYFRQTADPQFAVTGGHLSKIYDTYYLVGGQKFDGRYNPMNGPSFIQKYTDAVRKFIIHDDGTALTITHLLTISDPENLHRRDYNLAPQILPNGQQGLTAFSGVFQKTADLPYLNCVNIDSGGYAVNNGFSQYYNHYHCAFVPLYSAATKEMNTVFFGGIAQFYDSLGILVQDNNVPFVKTIARVSRDANGVMSEYRLPVEMPSLLGAGAEFIPLENLPAYPNGVLKMDELTADTTMIGYIYGGIASSAANIFWFNTGAQSSAANQIFKVHLIKNMPTAAHELNPQSRGSLHLTVFPNPNNGHFSIKFNLSEITKVQCTIADDMGTVLQNGTLESLQIGENILNLEIENLAYGSAYIVTLKTPTETAALRVIVTE